MYCCWVIPGGNCQVVGALAPVAPAELAPLKPDAEPVVTPDEDAPLNPEGVVTPPEDTPLTEEEAPVTPPEEP